MTEPRPGPDESDSAREITDALADIARRSQQLLAGYAAKLKDDDGFQVIDVRTVTAVFQEWAAKAAANPASVLNEQLAYWTNMIELWQRTAARVLLGTPVAPLIAPAADDKRFKSALWAESFVFDYVKQCYLLLARHLQAAIGGVEGLDPATARKARFYTRQFVDAMAPTNFAATNPEVLKKTAESRGQNLIRGLRHMIGDLEQGHGRLRLSMTNPLAFKLGENIAATPGKVVFANDLMQLIQYSPSTDAVFQRPLLIVPPWINKFYILDLKPGNSFIKWAVDQGHTVFVISWVNPDASLATKTFADYMSDGPLAAIDAIAAATGEGRVNALGYCIGGTLTACTLAYMSARNDRRIESATFLTSLLDFSDVGEIGVFIDEDQLELLDRHMERVGYLEGHHMAEAFNLLRENDLIWSFVVNNYLLGREPMAFDLLYWNSDSTRMPAAMHSFYLRNMYGRNVLREPGGIVLDGVPIDLRRIDVPAYFLSTREDHIAPWRTTYIGAHLLGGPVRFVLGASGHVAGVVNPPAAKKYGYWTNDAPAETADAWLETARRNEGSWWNDWARWIAEQGGTRVLPRAPGSGRLAMLDDAPGSYVKLRIS